MLENEAINELIGVDESYKASDVLLSKLTDKKQKIELFNAFLDRESDLSFDWFTDYFQEEHSDRKNKKQDFTPDGVVTLVSSLLGATSSNADICAGTGGLTIKRWSENKEASYYCEEFSDRALPFLLFNLAIRNINATVFHGDSLSRQVKHLYKLSAGDKYSDIETADSLDADKFQTVVMNPPYSFKWNPTDGTIQDARFKPYEALAPKSKADYAFLLTGLDRLADNGTMAIILPHGVLFRGQTEEKIRRRLIELNQIEAVIGLPEKLFLNTDIPTVVLILKKHRDTTDVLFIDASKDYTKGKNRNYLETVHVKRALDTYKRWCSSDKYSSVVTFDDMKENDFNLNIPRYVDTFEPVKVKPLAEIVKDMQETDRQIQKNANDFLLMLDQLTSRDPQTEKELKDLTSYWRDKYGAKKGQQTRLPI